MAKRVCAEPGCPVLVDNGRCDTHRRERDRARGSTTARGYGHAHRAIRAAWQQRMDNGELIKCWRCKAAINPRHWHLGHDDQDRSKYRGPECPPCNLATSGRRISHM